MKTKTKNVVRTTISSNLASFIVYGICFLICLLFASYVIVNYGLYSLWVIEAELLLCLVLAINSYRGYYFWRLERNNQLVELQEKHYYTWRWLTRVEIVLFELLALILIFLVAVLVGYIELPWIPIATLFGLLLIGLVGNALYKADYYFQYLYDPYA